MDNHYTFYEPEEPTAKFSLDSWDDPSLKLLVFKGLNSKISAS